MPPINPNLLRELVAQGMNNCEIARRLGCGDSAVGKAAERLGLRESKPRVGVDVEKLFRLWSSDMLREDIARELGVSVSHLARLCQRHHLPKRKPMRNQADTDPTPDEIAARASECRERHYAARRAEVA